MVAIEPQYDRASNFSEGLALVGIYSERGTALGYINATGNEIVPLQYADAKDFSEGLAAVAVGKRGASLWGYINRRGETVIGHQYQYASSFVNGLALVLSQDDNFFGYISLNGSKVIDLISQKVSVASAFQDSLALVGIRYPTSDPFIITDEGQGFPIADPRFDLRYIDSSGKTILVIGGTYDVARPFSEGLANVAVQENLTQPFQAGFIDKTGKVVIDLKYNWADTFKEDRAVIAVYDEYGYPIFGFIDSTGREVVSPKYGSAQSFSEGLAFAGDAIFNGFIDSEGNEVINLFDQGLWSQSYNGVFSEGLAAVYKPDEDNPDTELGKWGFINKRGDLVVPTVYDWVGQFSEGFASVYVEGKWGYIYSPLESMSANTSFRSLIDWSDRGRSERINSNGLYRPAMKRTAINPSLGKSSQFGRFRHQ